MIGKTISHYKILEKLGEGGMGVVYRAEDTRLKRVVALKFLPPGMDANEPERARFLQEAQAAAALNHPNICTIHDVASENNQQFIVMEYVEGRTLKQMVPVRKIQDAIGYAIQIGEALQEAHSRSVVHRDIKTENIMVNAQNQIKVMDFGLAKLKGSLKLTKTSSTVGTLAYMAPEQIQGGAVDARSDIFSFGVVLYEMLTGHLPFYGDYEAAMVYSIVNEEPVPIQKFMPDISSELVHVLNRALEKDPEDRYQSIQDMVIELRRLKKDTSKKTHPVPAIQEINKEKQPAKKVSLLRKYGLLFGLGLMGVIAIGGAWYFLLNRPSKFVANRAAVVVFENRTGDSSLDGLGTFMTESVAQGLAGIGMISVVPSDVGIRTWQGLLSRREQSDKSDLLKLFGKRIGAKLVVSGAYYKEADSLRIHARVIDGETGKLLKVVGPVSNTMVGRSTAIETVQQRLMGGIAVLLDQTFNFNYGRDLLDYMPRYDSYREMQIGNELFQRMDFNNSVAYFRHAFKLDTTFYAPVLMEATAYSNAGESSGYSNINRMVQADSVVQYLEKHRQNMTKFELLSLDWIRYKMQEDRAAMLNISRQMSTQMNPRAPGYRSIFFNIGDEAFATNHLREAVGAFSKLNSSDSSMYRSGWMAYWSLYSSTYHLLGEYKQELIKARECFVQYPNLYISYLLEMRALAALGRTEEIWKLYNEVSTLPRQGGWTPGGILCNCAAEFRCHGFHDAYRQAIEKSIEWYTSRPDSEQQLTNRQYRLASVYYTAEKWDKAKILFEALNKQFPDNLDYIGCLGTIAARTGDIAEAKRIADFFKNVNRPYLFGNHTYWRACIVSLLDEKEEAVRLLREALAQGVWYERIHADMDLESLRDYPPFQELIKPKD